MKVMRLRQEDNAEKMIYSWSHQELGLQFRYLAIKVTESGFGSLYIFVGSDHVVAVQAK